MMGNKLVFDLNRAGDVPVSGNVRKTLAEALAERDAFLEKNPSARVYQNQIDRVLENAGPVENRMAVLAMMMEAKLRELGEQMSGLHDLLKRAVR